MKHFPHAVNVAVTELNSIRRRNACSSIHVVDPYVIKKVIRVGDVFHVAVKDGNWYDTLIVTDSARWRSPVAEYTGFLLYRDAVAALPNLQW